MKSVIRLLLVMSALLLVVNGKAQSWVNWTPNQLMEPSELAATINTNKDSVTIINVGPGAIIPNSVDVGAVSEQAGLDKLKATLSELPKDKKIVVYCGCCPFLHCPNVRPAINALKVLNFNNYYLLNLPNNIKQDWIEPGYPVVKKD